MNTKQLLTFAALVLPLGALSALALTPTAAHAGEVEAAEHRRLNQEMKKRAGSNAWAGVERAFLELVALQEKGEVITFEEWYLGAQAARGLGNIGDSRDRLQAALQLEDNEEARNWLADIEANYGEVSLKGVKKKDSAHELTIKGMPFAPDQRAAVEAAQKAVAADGSFDGLLPKGGYTFNSGECAEVFTVEPGGAVDVKCGGGGGGGGEDPGGGPLIVAVGPRVGLGGGMAWFGEALGGGVNLRGPDGGFSGVSPHLSAGVEAVSRLGVTADVQLAYHSLFATPYESGERSVIQTFGVNVGAGYRVGPLWLNAHGSFNMMFGSRIFEPLTKAQFDARCNAGESGCGVVSWSSLEEDPPMQEFTVDSGRLSGVGGSISYGFLDIGGNKLAATVSGGSMFSPYRNYPWAVLGLTFAPQPK